MNNITNDNIKTNETILNKLNILENSIINACKKNNEKVLVNKKNNYTNKKNINKNN